MQAFKAFRARLVAIWTIEQTQLNILMLTSKKALELLDRDQSLMLQVHCQSGEKARLLHRARPKTVVFIILVGWDDLSEVADMRLNIRKVNTGLGTQCWD